MDRGGSTKVDEKKFHLMCRRITPFNGAGSEEQQERAAAALLQQIQHVVDTSSRVEPPQQEKIALRGDLLRYSFEGSALSWFVSLSDATKKDTILLENEFQRRFYKRRTPRQAQLEIEACKQQEEESVFQFRDRIDDLIRRINTATNRINIDSSQQLLSGLREDLQIEAERMIAAQEAVGGNLSQEETFKLIQVAEQVCLHQKRIAKATTPTIVSTSSIDANDNEEEGMIATISNSYRKRRLTNMNESDRRYRDRRADERSVRCFNCGGWNHIAKNCTVNANRVTRSSLKKTRSESGKE